MTERYLTKFLLSNNLSLAELQEIKHDISSLRYEMIGSTSRVEDKVKDLWSWMRPRQRDFTNPSSSFDDQEELEAIIEQREEQYDNVDV